MVGNVDLPGAASAFRDALHTYVDSDAPTDPALVVAAKRLLSATEVYSGECKRSDPFAELFLTVTDDGRAVWRCAHRPRHPDVSA